jgi:hypothetical protein
VKIPLDQIKPGPLRHTTLPDALVLRLRVAHEILKGHVGKNIGDWIEGFQHDVHPEREVAIWEGIAGAYKVMCEKVSLSQEQKDDLFGFLLSCTTCAPEDALRGVKCLSYDTLKLAIAEHGKAYRQARSKSLCAIEWDLKSQ